VGLARALIFYEQLLLHVLNLTVVDTLGVNCVLKRHTDRAQWWQQIADSINVAVRMRHTLQLVRLLGYKHFLYYSQNATLLSQQNVVYVVVRERSVCCLILMQQFICAAVVGI
jgi:hypothetical protein